MEKLSWGERLLRLPVGEAYRDLEKETSKTIELHSRSLFPCIEKPFCCASRDVIHIFIDVKSGLEDHAIVHELTHAILMEQKYDRLTGSFTPDLLEVLANELQHPEVFRRMEHHYGLDMKDYWGLWARYVGTALCKMREHQGNQHLRHYYFPRVFTLFWFQKASKDFWDGYRAFDQALYEAAFVAYEEIEKIGFSTVATNLRSLQIFKSHWHQYCERHIPNDAAGLKMISAVAECHTERKYDLVAAQSEDALLNALAGRGLPQPFLMQGIL